MAFVDGCSCHVWAMDGWTSDGVGHRVDNNYVRVGTPLLDAPLSFDEKMKRLVDGCRVSNATGQDATVFGGWQHDSDGTPEHMWLEYNGWIYDTMPGNPLGRKAATMSTRLHPKCERTAFPVNKVGWYKTKLTVIQSNVIGNAVWQNDWYMP